MHECNLTEWIVILERHVNFLNPFPNSSKDLQKENRNFFYKLKIESYQIEQYVY